MAGHFFPASHWLFSLPQVLMHRRKLGRHVCLCPFLLIRSTLCINFSVIHSRHMWDVTSHRILFPHHRIVWVLSQCITPSLPSTALLSHRTTGRPDASSRWETKWMFLGCLSKFTFIFMIHLLQVYVFIKKTFQDLLNFESRLRLPLSGKVGGGEKFYLCFPDLVS